MGTALAGPSENEDSKGYYQLTHDYLVPSVREWLDRGLKATRKGRAELKLRDMSQLWNARPERRLLPPIWEVLQLKTLINSEHCTKSQRDFMRAAVKHHATRTVGAFFLALIVGLFCYEGFARSNAKQQVERLLVAESNDVANVVDLASKPNSWLRNELRLIADDTSRPLKQRRHASIALLNSDLEQIPFLAEQVATADEEQLGLLTQVLAPYQQQACVHLWPILDRPNRESRLNSAAALAEFAPNDDHWKRYADRLAHDSIEVPSESRLHFKRLKPVASHLISSLLREANGEDVVLRRVRPKAFVTISISPITDCLT